MTPPGEGSPPLLYPIDESYVMERSLLIGDSQASSPMLCADDQPRGAMHLGTGGMRAALVRLIVSAGRGRAFAASAAADVFKKVSVMMIAAFPLPLLSSASPLQLLMQCL